MSSGKCVALVFVAALAFGNSWAYAEDENFAIAVKAFEKTHAALRSARGRGEFVETFTLPEKEKETRKKATFNFATKDRKFFIDMKYEVDRLRRTRRTIVYDGEQLTTTRFSENIKPFGGESEILSIQEHPEGLVRPQGPGDFPWDISQLPANVKHMTYLVQSLKENPTAKITSKKNPEGDIELRLLLADGRHESIVDCPKSIDYNVARVTTRVLSEKEPRGVKSVEWKSIDGVWVITELHETMRNSSGLLEQFLVLHDVEVNKDKAIDDKQFTFEALEAPSGSRILDRRAPKLPIK